VAAAPSAAALAELKAYEAYHYNPSLLYKVGRVFEDSVARAFEEELLRLKVKQEDLVALTIRSGGQHVELTCKQAGLAMRLLRSPIKIGSRQFFPVPVDNSIVVHLRGITVRMRAADVVQELAKYGTVHALWGKPNRFRSSIGLLGGLAAVRMTLNEDVELPHKLSVVGEPVDVWYLGKPKYCGHCDKTGHVKKRCPTITCRRCDVMGHTEEVCPKTNKASAAQPAADSKTAAAANANEPGKPGPKSSKKVDPTPAKKAATATPSAKTQNTLVDDEEPGWQRVTSKKNKKNMAKAITNNVTATALTNATVQLERIPA